MALATAAAITGIVTGLGSAGMSIAQAGKAKKQAAAAADQRKKYMEAARKKAEVNFYEALNVPTSAYNEQFRQNQAGLTQGIQALQEGLGAIREVLLDGHQDFYCETYFRKDRQLRRALADSIFLSSYPRLVLEPLGIALIAFIGFILVRQQTIYFFAIHLILDATT